MPRSIATAARTVTATTTPSPQAARSVNSHVVSNQSSTAMAASRTRPIR
ncbi:hypothetical protein [Streptomyces sp. NPDC048481]